MEYYFALRWLLKTHPRLRRYLTRCRHCGIWFLTDPRNAGRSDLGCPFGCRDAHRRRKSTERSVAYYQADYGRIKKKIQNDRRGSRGRGVEIPGVPAVDEAIVGYLQAVAGLIEGRRVGREEIVAVLRQHSMDRRREIEYKVEYLLNNPP